MACVCVTSHGTAVGDGLLSTPQLRARISHRNLQREISWLSLSQTQYPQAWPAWPIMDLWIGTLNGVNEGCFPFPAERKEDGPPVGRVWSAPSRLHQELRSHLPWDNAYFAKKGSLKRKSSGEANIQGMNPISLCHTSLSLPCLTRWWNWEVTKSQQDHQQHHQLCFLLNKNWLHGIYNLPPHLLLPLTLLSDVFSHIWQWDAQLYG